MRLSARVDYALRAVAELAAAARVSREGGADRQAVPANDRTKGTDRPVTAEVIRACRAVLVEPDQLLFVGGGIKSPAQAAAARAAGADFVVVGTVVEQGPPEGLAAYVRAVRG